MNSPVSGEEFDRLPFPDHDVRKSFLIDNDKIFEGDKFYNKKMYTCFASRGCPLSCSYCLAGRYKELYALHGHHIKKYRVRSVDSVIREPEEAKKNGAIYIKMNDEVFPANKDWVNSFIELYKTKVNLPFFAYIRPEFHDVDTVKRMSKAGLCSSAIGIQSGSEHIRKNIYKRNFSNDKLFSFAEVLNKYGIQYYYHIMNYNPFEAEDDMLQTFRLLCSLPLSSILVIRLVPHPGTPIYKMIKEEKPEQLSDILQKRYGYLYTMAVTSENYRRLSIFIQNHNLFRSNLFVFRLLFNT